MGKLQEDLERTLLRIIEQEVERLIAERAEAAGCRLSSRECRTILNRLKSGSTSFALRKWRLWERRRSLALEIEGKDIDAVVAKVEKALPGVITKVSDDVAPLIAKDLIRRWPAQRRSRAAVGRKVLKRIGREWGPALHLLGMILAVTEELAANLSNDETLERDARHATFAVGLMSLTPLIGVRHETAVEPTAETIADEEPERVLAARRSDSPARSPGVCASPRERAPRRGPGLLLSRSPTPNWGNV